MRVIVADDSVLLREGVVRLLEEGGFEVVAQAGDADDLLRKTFAHKPDVAVVDVRMPPTHTDDGLKAAIDYAISAELTYPPELAKVADIRDLRISVPLKYAGEAFSTPIGPLKAHAPANGIIIRHGAIVAEHKAGWSENALVASIEGI